MPRPVPSASSCQASSYLAPPVQLVLARPSRSPLTVCPVPPRPLIVPPRPVRATRPVPPRPPRVVLPCPVLSRSALSHPRPRPATPQPVRSGHYLSRPALPVRRLPVPPRPVPLRPALVPFYPVLPAACLAPPHSVTMLYETTSSTIMPGKTAPAATSPALTRRYLLLKRVARGAA